MSFLPEIHERSQTLSSNYSNIRSGGTAWARPGGPSSIEKARLRSWRNKPWQPIMPRSAIDPTPPPLHPVVPAPADTPTSLQGGTRMCGITGLIDPSLSATEIARRFARDERCHHAPRSRRLGALCQDGAGIGMRRLSIIDVAGGQQPIANESGDVQVVCNGEIYNFRELRRELEQRGHRFATNSDAEVIVHLYEDHGAECLKHLACLA